MDKSSIVNNILQVKEYFKNIIISDLNIDTSSPRYISWFNYESGIEKNVCYQREYQKLLDSQQYSILLEDSSFIQFYYNFNENGELNLARLAYYPYPKKINESQDDILEYAELASESMQEIYLEMIDLLDDDEDIFSNNSHIRFDFDSSASSHSKAHLQFGGINDFRITTSKFVSPFIFLDSITRHFFQEWHEKASQKKPYIAAMKASVKLEYITNESDHFYITT